MKNATDQHNWGYEHFIVGISEGNIDFICTLTFPLRQNLLMNIAIVNKNKPIIADFCTQLMHPNLF